MNVRGGSRLILCIFLGAQLNLFAQEFTQPKQFTEFGKNMGDQQVVDVNTPWVGATPDEIAPGVVPLGSLVDKSFFIPDRNLSLIHI